jgi:cupin superfamily acireductone dioxygenase involved in methionine salvage
MDETMLFCSGNAIEAGQQGWFIGQFVPASMGLRHQTAVEVKWRQHPKGEQRTGFSQSKTATTISILVTGILATRLKVGDGLREVVLRKPGDFIMIGPGVPHFWEAMEECLIISVRFPSIESGQMDVPTPLARL